MQTVIETESYLRAAKDAGMAEDERAAAIDFIAIDPEGGDVMQGTGGVRKARLAGRGPESTWGASRAATASSGTLAAATSRSSC